MSDQGQQLAGHARQFFRYRWRRKRALRVAKLRACLREAGFGAELITFWDDVAKLKWIREGIGHKLFKGEKVSELRRPLSTVETRMSVRR